MADEIPEFDFFERKYFHEIEVKNEISQRVNAPLTVLVAMIGAMAVIVQAIQINGNDLILFVFGFAFSFALIFIIRAIFNLTSAMSGHRYLFAAKASEWDLMLKQMRAFYESSEDSTVDAFIEVKKEVLSKYIECATRNAEVNDIRSEFMYFGVKYLLRAALALLVSFFIFHFGGLNKADQPHRADVKIIQN